MPVRGRNKSISTLSDVSLTGLSDQDILKYNATSGKWENEQAPLYERAYDYFIVTSPSNKVYSLGHIAADNEAEVHLNGVIELFGTSYTVSGSTITLDANLIIATGDKIDVWYNYSI